MIAVCGFAGSVCNPRRDPPPEPTTSAIEAQAISTPAPTPTYVAPTALATAPTHTPPAWPYDPWQAPASEPEPSYREREPDAAPSGATAQCMDGTYSYSANRRGTCSHHGGVSRWL